MIENKKFNIAIVGLGHWGPNIVNSFKQDSRVGRIVGFDMSQERIDLIKEKCPWLEIASSYESILKDDQINAVVIATPTETHYALSMQALDAGKPLFVEKPLAHNSQAASDLADHADKKNLTLMTGHVFLYNTAVVKMKEIIESGELGNVLYVRSVRSNLGPIRKDVNALWDLAAHDISMIDYIFGSDPLQVSCCSFSPLGLKQEDISIGALEYSQNRSATFFVSWLNPTKTRELTVVGDHKMLIFDDMSPQAPLKICDQGVKFMPEAEYSDTFESFRMSLHMGQEEVVDVTTGQPLKNECEHFIDCLVSGERPFTDGANGLKIVQTLEALQQSSLKHGAPISFYAG